MSHFEVLVGLVWAGEVLVAWLIERWLNRHGFAKLKILVLGFAGFRTFMFGLGVADAFARKSTANMFVPVVILSLWITLIISIVKRDASIRARVRKSQR